MFNGSSWWVCDCKHCIFWVCHSDLLTCGKGYLFDMSDIPCVSRACMCLPSTKTWWHSWGFAQYLKFRGKYNSSGQLYCWDSGSTKTFYKCLWQRNRALHMSNYRILNYSFESVCQFFYWILNPELSPIFPPTKWKDWTEEFRPPHILDFMI